MAQLRLTGFTIFLFFLTVSLTSSTSPQVAGYFNVTQKYINENVGPISIISFAQSVQEASFEEIEVLVKNMIDYRDKCVATPTLRICFKLPLEVLHDSICSMEGLPQKYNLSHCCNKTDSERMLCFFYNKKTDVEFLPPLSLLNSEDSCPAYENDRESFLNKFIYEVSRRNPFFFAPTILTAATLFERIIKECCKEEEKTNCFRQKGNFLNSYLKARFSFQKTVCGAYLKFGPKPLSLIMVAVFTQKIPESEFKELISFEEDIASEYDSCCEGDAVNCLRDRSRVVNHICSKQDSISSTIKMCCEKAIPEQGECVYTMTTGKALRLPLPETKFTEHENACQERKKNPYVIVEILYEHSRTDPDLPVEELVRIAKVYEDLLDKCCEIEKLQSCYRMLFLVNLVRLKPNLRDTVLKSLLTDYTTVVEKCFQAEEQQACLDEEGPVLTAKIQAA